MIEIQTIGEKGSLNLIKLLFNLNILAMKKLIIILSIALLVSCKKEENTPDKTTYRIINNMDKVTTNDPYLNGSLYELVVFCYKGTDIARQDNIDSVRYGGGKSEIIEAAYDKVKVSFKFLPKASTSYNLSTNKRNYTVTTFYLTQGKNTDITIDGTTMISSNP